MKRFILKVDDFRLNEGQGKFQRLIELCDRQQVPMSIGAIGQGLKGGRFQLQELFSRSCRNGTIEPWNHSFNHKDMTQLTDSEVAWEIASTNSIIERLLGHAPVGFGAPFNKCDARIARIASEQGLRFTYETAFPPLHVLTPEYNVPFDGQPNLDEFIKRVERKAQLETIVVQVHPGRWLTRGFDQMARCLTWLRGAGYEATTASRALGLTPPADGGTTATGAHALMVRRLVDHWSKRAADYDARLSNFSSYFLSRFGSNSHGIRRLLRDLDADLAPRAIVDVGCGLAQWGLPFFDFNKDATLWAFDTNQVLADALTDAMDAKLVPYDLRVAQEDFTTSSKLPHQGIDHIVCANALNYIPTLAFAEQAQAVAKDGAQLVLLNQTGAFNRQGVADALDSANVGMAKERAMAALRQELVRSGFTGFLPARTTPTSAELEAVLYAFGFQLGDDFIPSWERKLDGAPTFEGLVFVRRSWIDPQALPQAFRPEYRQRLCRAGFPQLDDKLFADHEYELKEPTLGLLKARAGHERAEELDSTQHGELELGRLVRARAFLRVSQLVAGSKNENAEWLLAGIVSALIESDAKVAKELARRLPSAGLPAGVLQLAGAMCHMLEGDASAARAALELAPKGHI